MRPVDLRIGIDVGGTNTDAVLLDNRERLLGRAKAPTTPDVTAGIREALRLVLESTGEDVGRVTHVMLGTTHATNALLERRRLQRVAVLRLGGPATQSVPPLTGWPTDLRDVICSGSAIVNGGNEFDGRELSAFDEEAARRFLESQAGLAEAVAIAGVFAPVSDTQEQRARQLAHTILGDEIHVSISSEIGSIGLLERENATVLNASLVGVAAGVAEALDRSLAEHGIDAVLYFTQNDGTLMSLEYAVRYPVLTIGSGPANSLRGAAFLTGATDAIVVDIGGTSTDLGVIVGGFPRESAAACEIGGIRTNFRMPDVLSIGLGGGSVLRETADGGARLGPDGVGYRLQTEALVFGGSTPTLTDAAVIAGRAEIGETAHLTPQLERLLRSGIEEADRAWTDAVDRVKHGRGDRPVVLVGGGSVLFPKRVAGASEILRPDHFDVANAVGAAIAMASGRFDGIIAGDGGRSEALEDARGKAKRRAVEAGADPTAVEIIELVETPLAYLDRPASRVVVRAAGPLALTSREES